MDTLEEKKIKKEAKKAGVLKKISETDKQLAALQDQVAKMANLVETLTQTKEEDEKIKAHLRAQVEQNAETINPQMGPGPACEAYRVHHGEALQLTMSQTPGVYNPVPSGFKVRELDGMQFLIKVDHPDNAPIFDGMTANCRSMYTEEYEYFMPKRPGQMTQEKAKAHLCRGHAKTLLGVSADQKASGINEIK